MRARRLRRAALVVSAAFVGYLAGGMVAAVFWLFLLHEAPGGGSGNASEGPGWFFVGAVLGAVSAVWFVLRRTRADVDHSDIGDV